MKFRVSRATLLLLLLNEVRGLIMVAPALVAALKAHRLL
jgi:hypothetical protein